MNVVSTVFSDGSFSGTVVVVVGVVGPVVDGVVVSVTLTFR